jgi:hypothetical protein
MDQSLVEVMHARYDSEIYLRIESFWDAGWKVSLGDEMNGFEAERTFRSQDVSFIPEWLASEAARLYPESTFAKTFRWAAAWMQ